jgi:hypothetical protein
MAKKADAAKLDWFGAESAVTGEREVTAVYENPHGKNLRVKTSGRNERIAEMTARYKMARSIWQVAPPDDKPQREREMEIALAEMQLERFAQQLEKYKARPNATPEQIEHYQQRIDAMRGRWLRLVGQE